MAKKLQPQAASAEGPATDALAEGYPSYRYHATEPRRIVATLEEDIALGPGWFNSPKDVQ